METLDPPVPGFLYSNIQERKAIQLLDQGSSILVPRTSPMGPSILWSETSLFKVRFNVTLSAESIFFFFYSCYWKSLSPE